MSLDPFSMFRKSEPTEQEKPKAEVESKENETNSKPSSADKKPGKGGEKVKKKKKPPKKIVSSPDNGIVLSPDNRSVPSPESRSTLERVRPGSISPKSTDISESLETDPKSPDLRSQRVAQTGSLAELREAFAADRWAEVDIEDQDEIFGPQENDMGAQVEAEPQWVEKIHEQREKSRSQSVESSSSVSALSVGEPRKPQSILKRPSVDLGVTRESVGDNLLPVETGSDDGDDERVEEDDEDDEMLEKTAVSKAMEQLLHDFDSKSPDSKAITGQQPKNETSDSGDNEVFIEGRLSPSGLKTRKFRLKRQTRRSKGEQRRMSKSGTSDSEAGRTDLTTTDNSQTRSSMSRSPSVEVPVNPVQLEEKSGSLNLAEIEVKSTLVNPAEREVKSGPINPTHLEEKSSSICETADKAENVYSLNKVEEQAEEQLCSKTEDTPEETSAVKNEDNQLGTGLSDLAMDTGEDTLRHVLESVAAMPDLSDNSDIDDLVIANVDDKFVTRRRGHIKKKMKKFKVSKKKKTEDEADKILQAMDEAHSSFSISTPSGSDSESVSSAVVDFAGKTLDIEPGDDDIKPDADMLKDYTTTMSLALGESYSDAEEILENDETPASNMDAPTPTPISPPQSESVEKDISNSLCNSVNGEKPADNESTATGNSSLYQTPNSSMNKSHNSSAADSAVKPSLTQRSLPKPNLAMAAPIPQPRKSLVSPTSPITPPLAPNARDSSGSEVFVSPIDNLPPPAFVNKNSSLSSSQTALSKPTSPPSSSILSAAVTNGAGVKSLPPTTSKATKPTSAHLGSDTTSKNVTSAKEPVKKVQRKLPELPKLNVLSRQPLQSAVRTPPDQPIMCSSPKIANGQRGSKPVSSPQDIKVGSGRPLPIPKSSASDSRKSDIVSSKPPQPTTSSPSLSKTPVTGKPTFSDAPSFTKPISKPVFKPPAKTKIPLDKTKLKLGSSSDKTESDIELDRKKKISADGIIIPKSPEDDIPFADESEAEEHFYTPCAPEKKSQPRFHIKAENLPAHKRLLPNPPSQSNSAAPSPGVLRADQIREIRQAEMERAKLQARERARLKSDEELGLVSVGSTNSTPTRGTLQQRQTLQQQLGHQRNASYDTASTSDVLSDSDDGRLRETSSPQTEETPETGNTTPISSPDKKNKKKKKPKTPKGRKVKKVITLDMLFENFILCMKCLWSEGYFYVSFRIMKIWLYLLEALGNSEEVEKYCHFCPNPC